MATPELRENALCAAAKRHRTYWESVASVRRPFQRSA